LAAFYSVSGIGSTHPDLGTGGGLTPMLSKLGKAVFLLVNLACLPTEISYSYFISGV
jgi:hypothetical protein